jgi:hypothetical protein
MGPPAVTVSTTRLQHVSKTGEHSRAQQSTPEHNELTTRQRVSSKFRRKSRAINRLAFWDGAGSTPAASTIQPTENTGRDLGRGNCPRGLHGDACPLDRSRVCMSGAHTEAGDIAPKAASSRLAWTPSGGNHDASIEELRPVLHRSSRVPVAAGPQGSSRRTLMAATSLIDALPLPHGWPRRVRSVGRAGPPSRGKVGIHFRWTTAPDRTHAA